MSKDTLSVDRPQNNFNYSDYKSVYSNLIDNVDEVLNDISQIDIQHIDVKKKNNETQSKLKEIRNVFINDIEKLDKNAVWDRFTIAFFGETNAGKSTIIESLRISMQEVEKLKNNSLKQSLDLRISELGKKSENVIISKKASKKQKIEDITSEIEIKKERAKRLQDTFWVQWLNVFRSWFGLLPILFFIKKIKSLKEKIFEINSIIPEQDIDVQKFYKEIGELKKDREKLFDGKIIGTGIPDFTQSCVEYYFNQEEKPFTLIDVPGIEGDENEYEEIIMNAVSKAHCVFYVCSAEKLPESGTVSKIKKYLKEQTEVYFLLNEKKHNYNYENDSSFEAMHSKAAEFRTNISTQMQNELGDFYKDCYSLQGLMAFCSKAEIQEDDRNFKVQKKFLDKFGTHENLYSISQLEKVEKLIRSQFNGMERKIINANVQKAICATIDFKTNIQEIRSTEYSNEFIQDIEREIRVVKEKNDNEYRQLENELNQFSYRLSNTVVEDLRIKLYHLVDNKENNSQLNVADAKRLLSPFYSDQKKKIEFIAKCYNTYVFDKLSQDYVDTTKKAVTTFKKNVENNINKMRNNIEQITVAKFSSNFENQTIGSFDILFSFPLEKIGDSVISIGGLAMAGLPFGPWGVAIGALLGIIFAGIKWFMNKETPESRAKKQIDEKLLSIKTEIKAKLVFSNKTIIDDCKENIINKIGIMLYNNINGIKTVQTILDIKINQLEILLEELKKTKN
ncbi:GTPase [Flavobacterium taihuense]|uniref:Dynamin family protein n=1 Tax=Flavobacterium taihuense TaxID=2857508 RepID=A0ABS6Y2I7_9FLAO|nr:GTPase [Flavobacterium taihuense]MBW4362298.1 dynamin family protein [Flavobacterium taihuense]